MPLSFIVSTPSSFPGFFFIFISMAYFQQENKYGDTLFHYQSAVIEAENPTLPLANEQKPAFYSFREINRLSEKICSLNKVKFLTLHGKHRLLYGNEEAVRKFPQVNQAFQLAGTMIVTLLQDFKSGSRSPTHCLVVESREKKESMSPAGYAQPNEKLVEAAAREFYEETGIRTNALDLQVLGEWTYKTHFGCVEFTNHTQIYYQVLPFPEKLRSLKPDENGILKCTEDIPDSQEIAALYLVPLSLLQSGEYERILLKKKLNLTDHLFAIVQIAHIFALQSFQKLTSFQIKF